MQPVQLNTWTGSAEQFHAGQTLSTAMQVYVQRGLVMVNENYALVGTLNGLVRVNDGDWFVVDQYGGLSAYQDADFQSKFSLSNAPAGTVANGGTVSASGSGSTSGGMTYAGMVSGGSGAATSGGSGVTSGGSGGSGAS